MLRMFARRLGYVRTSTGADVVMFGISLPSDTVVHDIRVKVRGHSQSDSLVVASAHTEVGPYVNSLPSQPPS